MGGDHSQTAKVMIEGAKRWLRRNRTGLTVGFGVIGIGYLATQYIVSKITEARERIAGERTAKEKWVMSMGEKSGTDQPLLAYNGAFNKIKKTALSQSWSYCPRSPKM